LEFYYAPTVFDKLRDSDHYQTGKMYPVFVVEFRGTGHFVGPTSPQEMYPTLPFILFMMFVNNPNKYC